MMSVDEQIQLAEQIAARLPEIKRNEWMAWVQIAQKYGLEQAIQRAERLSRDLTVRPAANRANRLIGEAMKAYFKEINGLRPEERKSVLGYVAWLLRLDEKN